MASDTRRLGLVATLAILVVSVAGCGKPDLGGRVAISGTVNFEKKPLEQGAIEFISIGGQAAHTGAPIENGTYSIPAEKGLPPGKYRVLISSSREDPNAAEPEMPGMPSEAAAEPEELIPAEYNSESKEEVTVTKEGPNKFDFDI